MPRSTAQKEADRRYEKEKGKKRKQKYRGSKKKPKTLKVCSICGGTHHAKGLCNKHYLAEKRAAKKKFTGGLTRF